LETDQVLWAHCFICVRNIFIAVQKLHCFHIGRIFYCLEYISIKYEPVGINVHLWLPPYEGVTHLGHKNPGDRFFSTWRYSCNFKFGIEFNFGLNFCALKFFVWIEYQNDSLLKTISRQEKYKACVHILLKTAGGTNRLYISLFSGY